MIPRRRSVASKRKKPEVEDRKPVYAFPTRSRCEKCWSVNTAARSTQEDIQWRLCRDCGRTYKVAGKAV